MLLWRKSHVSYLLLRMNRRKIRGFFCNFLFSFIQVCKICKYANVAKSWRHKLHKLLMNMVKKDITPHLYQKRLFLCIEILLNVLHNASVTVLLAWQPTRLQTSLPCGYLWCSILIFANSASYAWSSKHRNTFVNLVNMFASWKLLSDWNQVGRDLKRMSCHSCVSCRTISLSSFNGLRSEWAKVALFMLCCFHQSCDQN